MMNRPLTKGFTLVETLVAIAILMISIVGPMYSVFQAVQTTYIARDQLIATALAQEGIEYVVHHRDNHYLYNIQHPEAPIDWVGGLNPCVDKDCLVDITVDDNTAPRTCSGASCKPLTINASKLYSYVAAQPDPSQQPSPFTRIVHITMVGPDEMLVTSKVSWMSAHVPFSITVTEHLYNWL